MADKITSSDMIREALETGVAKPTEITDWVKSKYGVEVKKSLINNVKQRHNGANGKTGKKRRGRPAKNGNVAPVVASAAQVSSNGEGKSQSELIRLALESGVSKPAEIASWVQETYGVEVGRGLVNQVKHKWSKGGSKKKRRGRRPAQAAPAPVAAAPRASAPRAASSNSLDIDGIVAVKELIGRFGKESLSKLIEVL